MKTVSSDMPRLKHLPFFSALDEAKSPATYTAIQAGLLALRLVDHWAIDGTIIVEPDSVGIQSLRTAIAGLEPADRLRECLIGIVNTMQSLQSVDIQLGAAVPFGGDLSPHMVGDALTRHLGRSPQTHRARTVSAAAAKAPSAELPGGRPRSRSVASDGSSRTTARRGRSRALPRCQQNGYPFQRVRRQS